jgi:hypothetical protein
MGKADIEDSLQRLDKLTQEEARMASAELLRITQSIERTVTGIDDSVQLVRDDVQDVGRRVEDRLDQANRSSFPQLTTPIPKFLNISQGTSSEIAFYDGFRLQTHLGIIISRQKLITTAQPNGSLGVVYSGNGKLLVPFCGFMEIVRSSWCLPPGDVSWSSLNFIAGSGKSVLWFVLPLLESFPNIYIANLAPRSFKTSFSYMTLGAPPWPIFISILETSTSKNCATCSLPSSSSFPLGPVLVVTSSHDSILRMTVEFGCLMIAL